MNPQSKIESLGVYLPKDRVETESLMASCKHRPRLNLEKITGIKERRFAVEGEYALDLAVKAAKRALEHSSYSVEDLELIVCTSISKYHREHEVQFEPSTAAMVAKELGAKNAICFDVVNACAGMFNGIHVVDGFIQSGAIRCGMVVSGEHNKPLVESAKREILTSFDGQLASLTLGDAGAAIILDRAKENKGFHYLESVTGAKHNRYCYSTPSKKGPGGILMTRARGLQKKGAEHFPIYLKRAVDKTGWNIGEIDVGIAHQVSVRGVKNGVRVVERFLNHEIPNMFVYNCDVVGNTTTTSHFVVLDEFIRRGKIKENDKILFVSGASGIVITHATYTMDEMATRHLANTNENSEV